MKYVRAHTVANSLLMAHLVRHRQGQARNLAILRILICRIVRVYTRMHLAAVRCGCSVLNVALGPESRA